jgi:spermidine synthase
MNPEDRHPRTYTLYLILFFLSGICGLVYEVVWSRMLALVMGNTVFAVSTVLAAFMGGLALGSWLLGHLADRYRQPLFLYGLLECSLGAYCLLLPVLLEAMVPLYRILYRATEEFPSFLTPAQFFFSGLLIMVPSTLMGGTLPVLTKFFLKQDDRVGSTAGRLYAVNTVGAVLGTLAAGFVLIPEIGVRASLFGAAGINLAIGVVALLMACLWERGDPPLATRRLLLRPGDSPVGEAWTVLLVFSASGAAALIYEVAWTRTLSLMMGPSVYAFSLMLGAFILGLALGSFWLSRIVDRIKNPMPLFSLLQWGVAFSSLAFIPLMNLMPGIVRDALRASGGSFLKVQLFNAGVAFAVMLIPATFLGAAFPIAVKLYSRSMEAVGKRLGALFAGNTVGAVVGSLAAGFFLIPVFGLQRTLLAAAFLNAVLGGYLLVRSGGLRKRQKVALLAVTASVFIIIVLIIPSWSRLNLASGPYKYFYRDEASAQARLGSASLLYYREGVTGTVAVLEVNNKRVLSISGKVDATSGITDMMTQLLIGHIPMLIHPEAKDVLVIGLASGVTLGAVANYAVEKMDAVEISYEVKEAAAFFSDINDEVLRDPRVDLMIRDGRNHLLLTDRLYDVIISEPSNPWMAGIGNLYTREFFDLARRRLHPGGIMVQWIEAYHMPNSILKSVIQTYHSVFPYVDLWVSDPADPGDVILLGSAVPMTMDVERMKRRLSMEGVREDLIQAGSYQWWQVMQRLIANVPALTEAVRDAPVHTDDRPFMEFELPKSLHEVTLLENAVWLGSLIREDGMGPFTQKLPEMSPPDRRILANARAQVAYQYRLMSQEWNRIQSLDR